MTVNQRVASSSLAGGAKINAKCETRGPKYFALHSSHFAFKTDRFPWGNQGLGSKVSEQP